MNRIKDTIIKMSYIGKTGHIKGAITCADILYSIYSTYENPSVVFSKGHASAALYAVMAYFGYIDTKELNTYCQPNSRLQTHPEKELLPNLVFSSGSLGMGLGIATGMAYGRRLSHNSKPVFVVCGDGETNEGSFWESAAFGVSNNLNVVCIIDNNNLQSIGLNSELGGNLAKKMKAFGWNVKEVNGYNVPEIQTAIKLGERPLCIVADTSNPPEPYSKYVSIEGHYKNPDEIIGDPLF